MQTRSPQRFATTSDPGLTDLQPASWRAVHPDHRTPKGAHRTCAASSLFCRSGLARDPGRSPGHTPTLPNRASSRASPLLQVQQRPQACTVPVGDSMVPGKSHRYSIVLENSAVPVGAGLPAKGRKAAPLQTTQSSSDNPAPAGGPFTLEYKQCQGHYRPHLRASH